MSKAWTESEIRATVRDYFDMLEKEVRREDYVKAEHHRNLLSELDDRNENAVEFKHMNISAVLDENGFEHLPGYQPRHNYQEALVEPVLDAVDDLDPDVREAIDPGPERSSGKGGGRAMLETTTVAGIRMDEQALAIAEEEYVQLRGTPDHGEEYKWDVLESLHDWYEEDGIQSDTVEAFVEEIREANPNEGTLIDWRDLDDLEDFVGENPDQASHALQQLFDEDTDLEDRISSFRETLPLGSGGVAFLLSVSNPSRYAPFRHTNFSRFVETFSDDAEEVLSGLSVAEKYSLYQRILQDLLELGLPRSQDDRFPVLHAQDFVYTVTSYPEPRFNTLTRTLQSIAKDLTSLKGDTGAMLETIRSLPESALRRERERYSGTEKVNWIRNEVLVSVLDERSVDLEEWKKEAEDRWGDDMLRNWTDYRILVQIPLNRIRARTGRYLDWIAEHLRDEVGSEDLDTHAVDFQGSANFPRDWVWCCVYPTIRGDHQDAYQFAVRVEPDGVRFGLFKGNRVENPSFEPASHQRYVEGDPPPIGEIVSGFEKRRDRFYALNEEIADEPDIESPGKLPIFEPLRRQLEKENQVVLYGPTGTGKTYTATNFARWWIDQQDGDPDEQIARVTFHPSFSYEDFLEGLTASTRDGDVVYEVEPGRLKEFATAAREAYRRADGASSWDRYVLVIDEINRGNLPEIFGETITLLESSKRLGESDQFSVQLSHTGEDFALPPNLYIVETMNTADHSIALLDTAIRRRFRFLGLEPDYEMLRDHFGIEEDDVETQAANAADDENRLRALTVLGLEEVNAAIRQAGNLGPGKQIGHAWFLNAEGADEIVDIWRYEVLPLLEEYYFGQMSRIQGDIFDGGGDALFDWNQGRIRDFDRGDLVDELESLTGVGEA